MSDSLGEFEIIRRYFAPIGAADIGEDCAVLDCPADRRIALSIDAQLADVHFPAAAEPAAIAGRALRCALSDLAAEGARPLGFLVALSVPRAEPSWLESFAAGLADSARQCTAGALLGGDLTRGSLAVTVQVLGELPLHSPRFVRSAARAGDALYVSGTLGDAAGGLQLLQAAEPTGDPVAWQRELLSRYWRPEPRLALGQALRGVAHAVIDLSDGLLADLGQLARASNVCCELDSAKLPISTALRQLCDDPERLALSGGDDYELCFSAAPGAVPPSLVGVPCCCIGQVRAGEPQVLCAGVEQGEGEGGWRHF